MKFALVAAVVTAGVGVASLSGAWAQGVIDYADCPGADTAISGTDDDDVLDGSALNDRIAAGGGVDEADGLLGDDCLFMGDGDDTGHGAQGEDRVFGEGDDDRVGGGRGDDLVSGGSGDDLLFGGPGDDDLKGGPGSDRIAGGGGNDGVKGGPGDDLILTRDGFLDVVNCGAGSDAARVDPLDIARRSCERVLRS